MSLEDYRARKFIRDVDIKLAEACDEAMNSDKRFTHEEVMEHMREITKNASKKI